MKQVQKGFTLIELMIVIAIIGILAAIAIPQYQDYVTRSKISEGLSLVQSVETAIAETYQSNGTMPTANNASFGLPQAASISGKYVDSIAVVATGTTTGSTYVTITYNRTAVGTSALAPGTQLSLTAITGAGSVAWVCGAKAVTINGQSYTGSGTTNVPVKYLPSNCRA